MKIAVVSKADSYGGGASRVASELVELLNTNGHVAHHWASWAGGGFTENMRPLYGCHFTKIKILHYGMKKLGLPELIPFELPILLKGGRIWDYDLIHFHDLSSAISPQTLSYLARKKPVLWTLHDCSGFTGGCLYPMGCEKYKTGCNRCEQIGEWPIDSWLDFTGFMQNKKRKLAQSGKVLPLAPSDWMADTAYDSGVFPKRPLVLSNGVDTEAFRPLNKLEMKQKFGLPEDRVVILLSAGSLLDERKGTRYALQALSKLADLNPYLLVVGSMDEDAKKVLEPFEYFEAGYIGETRKLADTYAAADLFLFCSLADNQPLSILETMATATPMIGFKTGGIPEMVVQNETGLLVDQKDIAELEKCLRKVLENPEILKSWGDNARKRVEEHYTYKSFVDRHIELYEKVLNNQNESLINID